MWDIKDNKEIGVLGRHDNSILSILFVYEKMEILFILVVWIRQ